MIRLMLVDDHAIVRQGLEDFLRTADDVEIVASAGDGAEGVKLFKAMHPDVVLMDLSMAVMDGVEATRQIRRIDPSAKIVVLTSFSERERILNAVEAGAVGYLLKDAEPEELLRAVRSAAAGDAPFSPKAALALLPRSEGPKLTERERAVLRLVAEGLANKQIATRLSISEKTVKAHLTNIFGRIGVTDRTQAALWASRNGLIE